MVIYEQDHSNTWGVMFQQGDPNAWQIAQARSTVQGERNGLNTAVYLVGSVSGGEGAPALASLLNLGR